MRDRVTHYIPVDKNFHTVRPAKQENQAPAPYARLVPFGVASPSDSVDAFA